MPGLSVDSVRAILTSTGAPVTDAKNNIVKPRLDLWAATPIACPNAARIEGGSYHSSLQAAYNNAVNGNTIQASKSISIIEGEGVLTINKSLTLQGGYDMCNFTPSTGYTFVQGDIHISSGTVTMGHIVVMR